MSCHKAGFIDKQDQLLASVQLFPDRLTKEETDLLQKLHPVPAIFPDKVREDSLRYQNILKQLKIDADQDDPVSTLATRYSKPLNVREAASYLGLSQDDLISKIRSSKTLLDLLAGAVAADAIDRQFWELSFNQIKNVVSNGEPVTSGSKSCGKIKPDAEC